MGIKRFIVPNFLRNGNIRIARGVVSSITLVFLFFWTNASIGQTKITWEDLGDVVFESEYHEADSSVYWYPTFGKSVLELAEKHINIKGYLIRLEWDSPAYMLSAYPFAACFFCGNAGPESVIHLHFEDEQDYEMDEVHVFSGRLELNEQDPFQMTYHLWEVTQVD